MSIVVGLTLSTVAFSGIAAPERMIGIAISINDRPAVVPLARSVGATSIRLDAPWKQVEQSRGQYAIPKWLDDRVNAMVTHGIAPLLILSYGNPHYDDGDKPISPHAIQAFARYAAFVAAHFKGLVFHYDLWNEWDAHTGRTTPSKADEYVKLAAAVYPSLKDIDPRVQLLTGGISDKGIREGFFERFFALGGEKYFDGLSIHPYIWNDRHRKTPEGAMQLVDHVAALSRNANGGIPLPIFLTEFGWPTHTGKDGVSEQVAAEYLGQYFLLAASRPFIRGIFWYCLVDQGDNPADKEHRFGIFNRKFESRPAAEVFSRMSAILGGSSEVLFRARDGQSTVEVVRNSG